MLRREARAKVLNMVMSCVNEWTGWMMNVNDDNDGGNEAVALQKTNHHIVRSHMSNMDKHNCG